MNHYRSVFFFFFVHSIYKDDTREHINRHKWIFSFILSVAKCQTAMENSSAATSRQQPNGNDWGECVWVQQLNTTAHWLDVVILRWVHAPYYSGLTKNVWCSTVYYHYSRSSDAENLVPSVQTAMPRCTQLQWFLYTILLLIGGEKLHHKWVREINEQLLNICLCNHFYTSHTHTHTRARNSATDRELCCFQFVSYFQTYLKQWLAPTHNKYYSWDSGMFLD